MTSRQHENLPIVHDGVETCPYLEGRIARMPLQKPGRRLTGREFDDLLTHGYRRYGPLVYRTRCPSCEGCEAIRIPVAEFTPRRTLARTLRKSGTAISATVGPPVVDDERVTLFNRHRDERELNLHGGTFSDLDYALWFIHTCAETVEIAYRVDGKLIGVAICDLGEKSLSAVYTYYDPDFEPLSPGSYSVLYQWQLCKQWGFDYVYLGFYVGGSPHMQYKARFRPHERLIDGRWRRFDDAAGASAD